MPKKYGIADLISYALMVAEDVNGGEPTSYKKVVRSKQKSEWLTAMRKK